MGKGCLNSLKERGFFQQCTNEENLKQLLERNSITFYAGFDPTNFSLHLGHLIPIMAMAHLQRMGHRPIALIGGGTCMIGDPTGKVESRKMLTVEQIDYNATQIRKQLEKFLIFENNQGLLVNNAQWLRNVNYIEFLRDIGRYFSVNRMLSFETYKERLKNGLSFLEFNYVLLQSYDFLELYRRYQCVLQIGGDDQWANMVSGVDLLRRVEKNNEVECLTFPLITTSDGKKMGKTEKGAVFLSPELTTPYDFYQYWINVTDEDVVRFLKFYTFLPLETIQKYESVKGEELNEAKKLLAFEVTKTVHGEPEAIKARDGAVAAFNGGTNIDLMPFTEICIQRFQEGIGILDLIVECGMTATKGEVRRLIAQGGCKINGHKIEDDKLLVRKDQITDRGIILSVGKKKVHRVKVVETE